LRSHLICWTVPAGQTSPPFGWMMVIGGTVGIGVTVGVDVTVGVGVGVGVGAGNFVFSR